MYGFVSFYWDPAELSERDRRAIDALNAASPALPSAGYATDDPDTLLAAYRTLLLSTDVRARGVALDQYAYASAQGRWGAGNPLTRFDPAVLAQARALLAVVPAPGMPLAEQPLVVAGWNSALAALVFLVDGDPADLPRIVEVLDSMVLDVAGFRAIEVRLVDADEPTCTRVGAWLAATAGDERLPLDVRLAAIRVFGDERYAKRLGHRDAIVALLDHADIRLSVQAAFSLVGLDEASDRAVRRAVAGWPEDAPYPASEVRDLLADRP